MLGALRRVSTNTRVVGTLVAFSVGIVAAVVARADDGDMTSTVRVTLGATLGDLSKASLTRLPVPAVGAPTRVEAGALWRDRPAVILVLRRPGWVLCRSEAAELHAHKAAIEAAGGSLACLLKGQDLVTGEEVAGFRNQDFWHPDTPMYFDDDLAFFRAFGNGKLRKGSNAGLVGALLNPFSAVYKTYGKTSDAIKENADLVGEGKIMGGLFVISKNGVEYAHKEKHYGTVAPVDEVLAAVESAAKGLRGE